MSFRKLMFVFVFVAMVIPCTPANAMPMPVMDVPAIAGIAKKISEVIKQARDYVAKAKQYKAMIEAVGKGGFEGIVDQIGGQLGVDVGSLIPKPPAELGSIMDNIEDPGAAAQATADAMYIRAKAEAGQEIDAAQQDAAIMARNAARMSAVLSSWALALKVQDTASSDEAKKTLEDLKNSGAESQNENEEFKNNTQSMITFVEMLTTTNMLTAQAVILSSSEYLGD